MDELELRNAKLRAKIERLRAEFRQGLAKRTAEREAERKQKED